MVNITNGTNSPLLAPHNMSQSSMIAYLHQYNYILANGKASPRAKQKLKNDSQLQIALSNILPHLNIEISSFAEIKFCLLNNISKYPICPICENVIIFEKSNSYYPITCSRKCMAIHHNKSRFINNNPAKNIKLLTKRAKTKRLNFLQRHPKLLDGEWLILKHTVQHYSITELAKILYVTPASIKKSLLDFNITSPSQKILREASNKRKYGVNNVNELPNIRTKALITLSKKRQDEGYIPSVGEKEVLDFIKSILPPTDIISNTFSIISPKELDIYIPSHNLAIEYCGLYWHSEQKGKDKWYHYNKWKECNNKGIQLITIFEDEWQHRTEQVKNKLRSLLGVDNREKVYARKCQISQVSTKDKQEFFNVNHIQGSGPGSINIGLTYNNTLVACMSFIKKHDDKFYLNRYATSIRVVGGFSKLLTYFKRTNNYSEIISFADRRWSNGKLYINTDWTESNHLKPDYSYKEGDKRVHKFNYRRKYLKNKLKHFDPKSSERENCNNNGVLRIWDCGKMKFIMENIK